MRVAFIIEHLDPNRGGMERSAVEFLTELVELGPEVHVVTQTSAWDHPGIHVHTLGVSGWTDEMQYRDFVDHAQQFLADRPWDIIHAVRPCLSCTMYQPRGGIVKAGQERTVATRRNGVARLMRHVGLLLDAKERLLASLEHRLLTRPSPPVVVVPSDYVRRQVEERYRLSAECMRRVFNGVSVTPLDQSERARARGIVRREVGVPPDAPVAIFVGHNFRRKGLARILESLAKTAAQGWYLLILGRGAAGHYERYAQQLRILDRVRFLGSRAEAWDFYCAADVCVLPTYNDPCSRTILEALSLGLPCITTAYDGSSECMRDGEHGFVINSPESVDALANALDKLRDAPTRLYMSEQTAKLRPYLSMRRHAAEVNAVYREIAGRCVRA
ncbi:MAG TPA: glycosyltransferase family 4 protein [Nitrospiraceae bacterium]|nr:glycosyltransferase family 4 protein [Nitrospiraceae bacterium]